LLSKSDKEIGRALPQNIQCIPVWIDTNKDHTKQNKNNKNKKINFSCRCAGAVWGSRRGRRARSGSGRAAEPAPAVSIGNLEAEMESQRIMDY
jgi:hypothetical protein